MGVGLCGGALQPSLVGDIGACFDLEGEASGTQRVSSEQACDVGMPEEDAGKQRVCCRKPRGFWVMRGGEEMGRRRCTKPSGGVVGMQSNVFSVTVWIGTVTCMQEGEGQRVRVHTEEQRRHESRMGL